MFSVRNDPGTEACTEACKNKKRNGSLTDQLIQAAEKHDGKKFIFVIDEWDAMIREAKDDRVAQKHYPALLESFGGEILLVGINYDSKSKVHTCRIERLERNSEDYLIGKEEEEYV